MFKNFCKYILDRNQIDPTELENGAFNYRPIQRKEQTDQLISFLQNGLSPKYNLDNFIYEFHIKLFINRSNKVKG